MKLVMENIGFKRGLTMLFVVVLSLGLLGGVSSASDVDEADEVSVKVEEDKTKPTVEYAYMLEGKFYIEINDEGGFDRNPYEAVIDGEDVDDFEEDGFELDIPTKLILEIVDAAENKIEVVYEITMEDQILDGDVPEKIKSKIERNQESDIDVFDGFEHIVEGEYNKIINLYDTFEMFILQEFGAHNDGDIAITGTGLTVDQDYDVLLNKEGLFSFKIGHVFYTDNYVNVYVYVDNDSIKYTNIDDIYVVNPGITSKTSVKLMDFLSFDLIKEGYTPVTSYIVAKDNETNKDIDLNTSIQIADDKQYSYKIKDVLSGKEFFIEFIKAKPIINESASYSDVSGSHWAFYSIKSLTLGEFINGYPDSTFKPSSNITVREFSTILSRYLSKLEKTELSPVIENYYLGGMSDWGYIETKSILATIPRFKMSSFDISNINRPISREEVAFLIVNNAKLEMKEISSTPIDAMSTKYPLEVLTVIGSGLMEGYPDNTFKPNLNITRAEIATIFDRLLNPEETE